MHCGVCIVVMLVSILPSMTWLIINYYPSPPLPLSHINPLSSQHSLLFAEIFSVITGQDCFDLYKLVQSLCLLSRTSQDINIYFKKNLPSVCLTPRTRTFLVLFNSHVYDRMFQADTQVYLLLSHFKP